MKIKNAIFILILASFISCTQSSEKQIIGLWQGSDLAIKNDTLKMDSTVWNDNRQAHKGTTYEFKADHNFQVKMVYKDNMSVSNGKWEIDDKRKILSIIDTVSGMAQEHQIDELSKEKLTLRSTFSFGEVTVKFTRKK